MTLVASLHLRGPGRGSSREAVPGYMTPAARCDVPADCEGPSPSTAVAANRNPLGRGWPLESARVSPMAAAFGPPGQDAKHDSPSRNGARPPSSGLSAVRFTRPSRVRIPASASLLRTVVSIVVGAVICAPRGGSRVRALDRPDPGGSPDRARSICNESNTQKLGRATPATVLRLPELSLATCGAPPLRPTEHVPVVHAFTVWAEAA